MAYLKGPKRDGKKYDVVALGEYTRFGNAVASLCVEKRGAIPAMPTLEEVKGRL